MSHGFDELLGVNQRQALMFFYEGLQDVIQPAARRRVGEDELAYTASIMAHYAQVSQHRTSDMPLPLTLRDWFFRYIFDPAIATDPEVIEAGAAQCLMLTGYFSEGMARRHSISSYSQWGSEMFQLAAVSRKRSLLTRMGLHFELWRQTLTALERDCRHRGYLIDRRPLP
jgi:hypothetical protein